MNYHALPRLTMYFLGLPGIPEHYRETWEEVTMDYQELHAVNHLVLLGISQARKGLLVIQDLWWLTK